MKKWINLYKYYIFFFICILLVSRMMFSRYNMIFIKSEKHYEAPIFIIIIVLITWILIFNNWYREKYNPNKDTIIKKILRNNPKITNGFRLLSKTYYEIYTYRIMEIDEYLERFKIYKNIQRLGGNFYDSYVNFSISIDKRRYKDIKFMGLISYIFYWSTLLFGLYLIIQIYYMHILNYNFIAIFFLLLLIRKITKYWDKRLTDRKKIINTEINNIADTIIDGLNDIIRILEDPSYTIKSKMVLKEEFDKEINRLKVKKELLKLQEAGIRKLE